MAGPMRAAGRALERRPTWRARSALRRALIGGIATAALWPWAGPASAMCAGNIFVTCPPAASAASAEAARAKREKRLKAVTEKKRHYPLLKR